MNHCENVDHDRVLRARTLLLGSGTINVHEEIDAYRVLTGVSPVVYLPRLARALLEFGTSGAGNPATRLPVLTEAAAAAERMDAAEPGRAPLLLEILEACREELHALGRTEEALAVGEEMARTAGGGQGTPGGGPGTPGRRTV
ncbi:hypothetical protein [Streptomyces sp. NBC_00059]|uniref:hypothetical protein n=1 Tax=Streptomyces sp. NBC_00059 TaxID=2975635 RepID=UPI002251F130|nr:hypothetical protein [Streptomyces sp. NBC_00059]MCX5416089.1 hypothetical protein [Streptomyces sp. NBC_00059]